MQMMKLLVTIAHKNPDKFLFLERQIIALAGLGLRVKVFVITDVRDQAALARMHKLVIDVDKQLDLQIFDASATVTESPWLLTWKHKEIMKEAFVDDSFTHFLNIEDDTEFTKNNFEYWLQYREILRPMSLWPSFLRVEFCSRSGELHLLEMLKGDRHQLQSLPRVEISPDYWFLSLPRFYQGMFLYDRELMQEHLASKTSVLDLCLPNWHEMIKYVDWPLGVPEYANFGISSENVPSGFYSRNLTPFFPKLMSFDPRCFIHHMPNKYVNLPGSPQGKVKIDALIVSNPPKDFSIEGIHRLKDQVHESKVSNKWSSYFDYYEKLFADIRLDSIRLLEIGVQNGGSLETWATFFSNATKILGCDIDERVGKLVFDDSRIAVLVGDVNSPSMHKRISDNAPFDIVVDDGSHTSVDIITSFVNIFPLLNPGGIYIIEDTHAIFFELKSRTEWDGTAIGFFNELSNIVNYQFWANDGPATSRLQRFFTVNVPSILVSGWIDQIEFRNSIITIRKAQVASHNKLGEMVICGNRADVDETPLLVKRARS